MQRASLPLLAAVAAAAGSLPTAQYQLGINVTAVDAPLVPANVTWRGITGAATGDWLAVCCR